MTTKTIQGLIAIAAVTVGLAVAVPAEAGRPCRRLCRRTIASNIAEHCAGYPAAIKRLCRKDVRSTIINYCQRQTGAGCYGD